MARKSSIFRKGLALIAIPIAIQIFFAGFLLVRQRRVDEAGRWAIHTKVVIAQAETMFRTLVEADSAVRAMITMSDPTMDKAAADILESLPQQVEALVHLVRDNPAQLERLQAMQGRVDTFIAARQDLRKLATGNNLPQAMDQLRAVMQQRQVKAIRVILDEFLSVEDGLDKKRIADLARIQDEQIWILVIGGIILLGAGILSALVFGRSIVGRVNVLNANVRRLSGGETLVPVVSGHDEISDLDASFHQMANGLKAAAENEKHHQESLERRAAELVIINRELRQKSDENEMFVYSVSHDLRSPLVNLQGFGKELGMAMGELKTVVVGSEAPKSTKDEALEIIEHGMAEPIRFIQTAVTRLSAIIDALLRLSRAGRVEYQPMLVDVQGTVNRVVDATRSTMVQKGASVAIAPRLPSVWADPTAVEQIFGNLIGNALNYLSPQRPGKIDISAEPPEADSGLITFRVQDNGLGIPEAYAEKIFSIFQRVHGNIAPGEGIGLALVRRMVERHGGRIWVESTENVGSSFLISLPSQAPRVEGNVAETPASSSPAAQTGDL